MSRTGASIKVSCDAEGCDHEEEFELTALAIKGSWDERTLTHDLRINGWTTDGKRDICPDCSAGAAESESAS